jgi:toxin ParE1/3/4
MKYRLSPAAARDLADIRAFIGKRDRRAARRVAEELQRSFRLLATRPGIGRPTHRPEVREWSVPGLPYVVPYRVGGADVEIVRVFHTARQRPEEW